MNLLAELEKLGKNVVQSGIKEVETKVARYDARLQEYERKAKLYTTINVTAVAALCIVTGYQIWREIQRDL